MDTLSTPVLADQIGCTYRELDYWCRLGALDVPASGSGTSRRFGPIDARLAHVVARLRQVGAPLDVCRQVTAYLRLIPMGDWRGQMAVTPDGRCLRNLYGHEVCWLVDLDTVRQLPASRPAQQTLTLV